MAKGKRGLRAQRRGKIPPGSGTRHSPLTLPGTIEGFGVFARGVLQSVGWKRLLGILLVVVLVILFVLRALPGGSAAMDQDIEVISLALAG